MILLSVLRSGVIPARGSISRGSCRVTTEGSTGGFTPIRSRARGRGLVKVESVGRASIVSPTGCSKGVHQMSRKGDSMGSMRAVSRSPGARSPDQGDELLGRRLDAVTEHLQVGYGVVVTRH